MRSLSFLALVCALCLAPGAALLAAEESPSLSVGDTAPAFNANTDTGDLWQSSDHVGQGKYLVVYFYPAAMTGGCTQQACSYRDQSDDLTGLGAEVVGVSADPVSNLEVFKRAHSLNFTLLSDVNATIARRFGVPVREGGVFTATVDGKEVALKRPFTLVRWTFVIDGEGKVVHKDTSVNTAGDSGSVAEFLRAAKAADADG